MTEAAAAIVALLAQPDPPDLRTPAGLGRQHRQTVAGKDDRHGVLGLQPLMYRTWKLVARDTD